MPDLKITSKMSKDAVLVLIDAVWPELSTKLTAVEDAQNKVALRTDYAALVEFLTDKAKVIDGLKPLDEAIRLKLEQPDMSELKTKAQTIVNSAGADSQYYTGEVNNSKPFKTHKVLSGALEAYENLKGFNGAQATLMKLHTTAKIVGDASLSTEVPFQGKEPTWQTYNTGNATKAVDLPAIQLPTGAPTLSGILKKSFNPILLKNGFHWKDPGADALVHGEFTHRLQWYAIGKEYEAGKLTLSNTPVQIFKSMGYLFATGKNTSDTQRVYLWELVCDNFDKDRVPTPYQPYTSQRDCFTCPDFLNGYLSRGRQMGAPHDLPYLNLMMRARYIKRDQEQKRKENSLDKIGRTPTPDDARTKKVGFGITSKDDEQPSAIYWVKHS